MHIAVCSLGFLGGCLDAESPSLKNRLERDCLGGACIWHGTGTCNWDPTGLPHTTYWAQIYQPTNFKELMLGDVRNCDVWSDSMSSKWATKTQLRRQNCSAVNEIANTRPSKYFQAWSCLFIWLDSFNLGTSLCQLSLLFYIYLS